MKQLVIVLTADFEIADDFRLTAENYQKLKVTFAGMEASVRNATLHIKEPKKPKKKAVTT